MSTRLMHGICTYFGQWLIGDLRGFRTVNHKIHSSGDYKNRPPEHEHEGLRNWIKSHMHDDPVFLEPPEFPVLGSAFVHRIHKKGSSIRCLSCGPTHVHLLYDSIAVDAKIELAGAKQYSSLKLETHPGRIWAKNCFVEDVDVPHGENLWGYILDHARKEGAWVWRYDQDPIPMRDGVKRLLDICKEQLRSRV